MSNGLYASSHFEPLLGVSKDRCVVQCICSDQRNSNGIKLDPLGVSLTRYQLNPIVLYAHSEQMIGRVVALEKQSKGIFVKIEYADNDFSNEIMALDLAGFLPGASIGFNMIDFTHVPDGVDVAKWELFEVSKVPVPADMHAIRLTE